MPRHAYVASLALACAAVSPSALAQETEATRLEEVSAEGRAAGEGTLTAPSLDATRRELAKTPGSVGVIDADSYKRSTPALTIKDALDYTPGVFAQPKWGDDTRLSIRGSGLSRNFHLRGVQLTMDGIPISTADGFGDFQEIDPSAYRMIEVYKGANALRFGANSLGGAINFVTQTGRDLDASLAQAGIDVGSFGHVRLQTSSGGAYGATDYFVTGSWQRSDGFRDHSSGDAVKFSGNIGYQLSEDVETRFYLNANRVRQNIPGELSKDDALDDPKKADAFKTLNDWERNIDTLRFANKTSIRLADTTKLDVGAFVVDRHLMHPIYQWLDYKYLDYGGFARLTDERELGGFGNRLVAGVELRNGDTDARQYQNLRGFGGDKGAKLFDADQASRNLSGYAEDTVYVAPDIGLVAGVQVLHATRKQADRLGAADFRQEFTLASPKIGVIWNVDPSSQVFANLSRSVEIPSFGENLGSVVAVPGVAKAQKAWTGEIGARGRRETVSWDVAAYRAELRDELQCQSAAIGVCTVRNLDKTVHQGVEAGFGVAILRNLFVGEAVSQLVDKGEPSTIGDKLWLNVAYTFSDFRFDDDPIFSNNRLPGAPRHFFRGELLYKHPSGVYAGPNVEWVPQGYDVDNDNTKAARTTSYALLGAKIGYDADGPFSAYVEGRNLLNKKYISSTDIVAYAAPTNPLYWPGDGRAVYAGAKYRW